MKNPLALLIVSLIATAAFAQTVGLSQKDLLQKQKELLIAQNTAMHLQSEIQQDMVEKRYAQIEKELNSVNAVNATE